MSAAAGVREEGYEVGITLVLEYLREWRRRRRSLRAAVHRPESAQTDFFEVSVEGERRKAWLFLMRLMHSRDFVRLRAPGPARLPRRPRAGRPLRRIVARSEPRSGGAAGRAADRALRGLASALRRRARFASGEGHARAAWSPAAGAAREVLTPIPRGTRCRSSRSRCGGRPSPGWERLAAPPAGIEARRLQPVQPELRVAWYRVPERSGLRSWPGWADVSLGTERGAIPAALRRPAGEYRHYLANRARRRCGRWRRSCSRSWASPRRLSAWRASAAAKVPGAERG